MTLLLNHLEAVRAIFDTGSVTGAAEMLKLSQPAVSYRLKQAELQLGGVLFDRQSGRMEATPIAQRLIRTARLVAEELDLAERDVAEILASREGTLRLSTVCSTAYHWLPQVLDKFKEAYPNVAVLIDSSSNRTPIEAVAKGELDVALTTDPPNMNGIIATPLFDDEIVAVVASGDPLATKQYLTATDFAKQSVIVFNHRRSDVFRLVLDPSGIRPHRVLDVEATEALVAMVRAGMGLGVLASWIVRPQLDAGELLKIRITKSGIVRKWVAVTGNRPGIPRYIRDFVRELSRQHRVNAGRMREPRL